jgi:ABC-2 type transport system permease protein
MSSAMVALGIATGFERQYGVLKRLGSTPLGRPRLVAAKVSMVLCLEVVQVALLVTVALLLGWQPDGVTAAALPAIVLGTAAFAGIGLSLAGTLSGTLNLAVTNGLYLVLLLFGGMVIPLEELPAGIRAVAELLPAAALSQTLDQAFNGDATTGWQPWLVLVAWAIGAPLAAARTFKWS